MEFHFLKGPFINDVTTLGGGGVHENMTFYDMGGGGVHQIMTSLSKGPQPQVPWVLISNLLLLFYNIRNCELVQKYWILFKKNSYIVSGNFPFIKGGGGTMPWSPQKLGIQRTLEFWSYPAKIHYPGYSNSLSNINR